MEGIALKLQRLHYLKFSHSYRYISRSTPGNKGLSSYSKGV